jgi:DNA-binding MarR family transcriptional regulator
LDGFQFRNTLEIFAKIDPAMPLSALQTLVWVGLNEGQLQTELENYLGTSNATASRSIAWWSDWRSFKDKRRGPGFIETYADPMDRRQRVVKLTPAGKAFFQEHFGKDATNVETARD